MSDENREAPVQEDSSPGRIGDWMQTYTGKLFWPQDPRVEDVCIEDIAHSLSLQCRFAGHCETFYSVAQHSVLVANLVRPEHRLLGLMHDASEAYITDVVRPIKHWDGMLQYRALERRVCRIVEKAFGLEWTPLALEDVISTDNQMLCTEAKYLMKTDPEHPWETRLPLVEDPEIIQSLIVPWDSGLAERSFLRTFRILTEDRARREAEAP